MLYSIVKYTTGSKTRKFNVICKSKFILFYYSRKLNIDTEILTSLYKQCILTITEHRQTTVQSLGV